MQEDNSIAPSEAEDQEEKSQAFNYLKKATEFAVFALQARGAKIYGARVEESDEENESGLKEPYVLVNVTGVTEIQIKPDMKEVLAMAETDSEDSALESLVIDVLISIATLGLLSYQHTIGEIAPEKIERLKQEKTAKNESKIIQS